MDEESEENSWTTKECLMHLFFDTCNCIGALPGGLIVGNTFYENTTCFFHPQKHFVIPENKILEFMKVLEDLAKTIIESSDQDEMSRKRVVLKEGIVSSTVSILESIFTTKSIFLYYILGFIFGF